MAARFGADKKKVMLMDLYFTDVFGVSEDDLDNYGAFNISVVTDLPLFIDPFLLFNSEKSEYKELHDQIIHYVRFLRSKSESMTISDPLLKAWYLFSEVKQNWLGFCTSGNSGRGLGRGFAGSLNDNLVHVFHDFGEEVITQGSHLEKLCLIKSGVGRDMISDFTTNLIKDYLLTYTQNFARQNIAAPLRKVVPVAKAVFKYDLERWMPKNYELPFINGDYVLLTPKDILTKDETWINYADMTRNFQEIPDAIENDTLRAHVNNYFYSKIPQDREPSRDDYGYAIKSTLSEFPQLIDYYIKNKEAHRGSEWVKKHRV